MSIAEQYSGIVINQNVRPLDDDKLIITDEQWRYQEVFLPTNYSRGSTTEESITPPLTGWQALVDIEEGYAPYATLDWTIEYQVFGMGWIKLAEGTTIGAHADGGKVWFDMYADKPIDVEGEIERDRLRFGFKGRAFVTDRSDIPVAYDGTEAVIEGIAYSASIVPGVPFNLTHTGVQGFIYYDPSNKTYTWSAQQGINAVWYSAPNPLARNGFVKAYASDGITPLDDNGEELSICFRVLGLTADEGTDFLGNNYRSAVRESSAQNTNTVDGSTNDKTWLSKPNPSRFAVENLYFDLRPRQEKAGYGKTNYFLDPRASTLDYFSQGGDLTTAGSTQTINDTAGTDGGSALSIVTPGINGRYGFESLLVPSFKAGVSYRFDIDLKGNSGGEPIQIVFGDATDDVVLTTDYRRVGVTFTPVADTAASIAVIRNGVSGSVRFFADNITVTEGDQTQQPFDGTMSGFIWAGEPNASYTREILDPIVSDDVSVIDKILVDPLTPGVYFTVYYTDEGDPGLTQDQWDNKLWTRVPQTFLANRRESHVLPQPILAKYVKIEFTHLQAQYYSPGEFAKPIKYIKHPKWVLDYFLGRLQSDQATTLNNGGSVAVVYDALDLAYNYYLDDLGQEPDQPVEVDSSYRGVVENYLSDTSDLSDKLDSETLDKVNLALAPYRDPPSRFASNTSTLGRRSLSLASNTLDYPVEQSPPTVNYDDVTSLRSDAVVFEDNYPVMFFYLTCRHKYREIIASFNYNKAYFVGINEIAFTRENYTTAFDTDQYIEPSGDLVHMERNDFTTSQGVLSV